MKDDAMVYQLFTWAWKIFMRPEKHEGIETVKEYVDRMRVPRFLTRDSTDPFFRPPKLAEDGRDEYFHVIASGKFADIIAARLTIDNKSIAVAAKRYSLQQLDSTIDGYTRLRREMQISRFHQHDNIVQFYVTFVECGEDKPEIPTHLWLVAERMDHSLEKYFEYLRRNDNTKEAVKRDLRHLAAMLCQLLRPLEYLHQRGIMHRDITPRNIGMNQRDFVIKLFDFGLARETNAKMDHSTNVDTPYIYKPLEVLMRAKYNTGVDIWAAALVAIEMLGMKLFLPEGTDEEITRKIRKLGAENAVMERIFQVHGVPDDQYQSIYHRPVSKRPMLGKLQEIFVLLSTRLGNDVGPLKGSDLFNLITRMLDPNPKNRLRADECLSHPFLLKMNEKYEERLEKQEQMKKNGLVQPKDDNGMRQRNEKDKEVLLKELAQPQNRRIFIDELMQADEMKDDEMKEGKDQEMIEEFSQIAT